MIRQAVILAAGLGSRLRAEDVDLPKPLFRVDGEPLLARTIRTLAAGGVERVVVVVGFMAETIEAAIDNEPSLKSTGVEIELAYNPEYRRSNGISVLAARPAIDGPFLLSMADHIFDSALPRLLVRQDMSRADLYLCVDRKINEVYDLPDATKVRTRAGQIVEIGKEIPTFDCIDCGVFAVAPELFEGLERARIAKGDCSLSDGVQELAARGRARVVDVGQAYWQDVDTPEARVVAESRVRKQVDVERPARVYA